MELRMESLNFGALNLNGNFFTPSGTFTVVDFKLRVVATNSQSPTRSSFSLWVMDGVMASNRAAADVIFSIPMGVVMKIPVGLSSARVLAVYKSSSRRAVESSDSPGAGSSVSTSDGASTSVDRRKLVRGGAKPGLIAKGEPWLTSSERSKADIFMIVVECVCLLYSVSRKRN